MAIHLSKINKGPKKETASRYSYRARKKSEKTVREMLLAAGYTPQQIRELYANDCILIKPGSMARTLFPYEDLYVVNGKEEGEPKKVLDRFDGLNLE